MYRSYSGPHNGSLASQSLKHRAPLPPLRARAEGGEPPGSNPLDRSALDRTNPDRTAPDRNALERTGLERTGLERTGLERSTLERAREEQSALESSLRRAPGPPRTLERENLPGRNAQQEQLRDYLKGHRTIQLLGEARMGCSSTLLWVSRLLMQEKRRHVLIDAQSLAAPTAEALLLAMAMELSQPSDAQRLPERTSRLPGEPLSRSLLDSVTRILKDGNHPKALCDALELMTPCVLLLDNADALGSGDGLPKAFFNHWRVLNEKGNGSGKLVWLSASRQCLFQRFKEGGQLHPFLNDAAKVWLGAIEPEVAIRLLENLATQKRERNVSLPPRTLSQAVEVTGGFADGLLWLGERLGNAPEKLDELADQFRETFRPTFQAWWENRTVAEQDILLVCARERLDARKLKSQDMRLARLTTRRLESLGLLAEQNGHFVLPGYAWREFVTSAAHHAISGNESLLS